MNLKSVFELSEVDSYIEMQVSFYLYWIDPRLNFRNLKKEYIFNKLTTKELSSIWLPELSFDNTETKFETDYLNQNAVATIFRQGNTNKALNIYRKRTTLNLLYTFQIR